MIVDEAVGVVEDFGGGPWLRILAEAHYGGCGGLGIWRWRCVGGGGGCFGGGLGGVWKRVGGGTGEWWWLVLGGGPLHQQLPRCFDQLPC